MTERLTFRTLLVRLKYRFDVGQGFLSVVNFALLLVMASDKLQGFLGITRTRYFVILCAIIGLGLVCLLGHILDKWRIVQLYNREANARNEDLQVIKSKVS